MFKYFPYRSLESIFLGEREINDEVYYIASISDLLFVVEQYKKNNLNISGEDLKEKFKSTRQSAEAGVINFIELDKDILASNLFEENDEGVLILDKKASNMKISPRFSISLICLKINEVNCYWSYEVFNEMEMYYLETESYG